MRSVPFNSGTWVLADQTCVETGRPTISFPFHIVRLFDRELNGTANGVGLDSHLAVGVHPLPRKRIADRVREL